MVCAILSVVLTNKTTEMQIFGHKNIEQNKIRQILFISVTDCIVISDVCTVCNVIVPYLFVIDVY